MSTSVSSVVSHFPDAENGFTTTLASTISSGATTVPLNSVAGYTNGQPAVFVVDPSDVTKKQTFTGIIDTSGVQLTSVVWTAGTNQTHAGGATVVDYATATHIAMMSKGILVHSDQDGTLKAGAVDGAGVLASGVVTEPKMADNSVDSRAYIDGSIDPEHLVTGAGTSWAMQTWSPTLANLTVGNGATTAEYTQIGKRVFFRFFFLLGSTSAVGSNPTLTLPVTAASLIAGSDSKINATVEIKDASSGESFDGGVFLNSTTVMHPTYLNVNAINVNLSATAPITFTTGDGLGLYGDYQAA